MNIIDKMVDHLGTVSIVRCFVYALGVYLCIFGLIILAVLTYNGIGRAYP